MTLLAHLSRRTKAAAVAGIALLCLAGVPIVGLAEDGTISGSLAASESTAAPKPAAGRTPAPGKDPSPPDSAKPGGIPGTQPSAGNEGVLPDVPHNAAPGPGSSRHFCATSAGWSETSDDVVGCPADRLITCTWTTPPGSWACTDPAGQAVTAPASLCQAEPGLWPCPAAASAAPPTPAPAVASTAPPAAQPSVIALPSTLAPTAVPAPVLPQPSPTASPSISPTSAPAVPPAVVEAIAAARASNLDIWVESDLAPAYLAGSAAFNTALAQLVAAAQQPGVTGVKYAASLAFSGFSSAGQVTTFLTTAHGALRAALPHHRLAVEVVSPELGCGQTATCVKAMRDAWPMVTAARVTHYLKAVRLDRVYVASGLFTTAYAKHKISFGGKKVTPSEAQWLGVHARGWAALAPIAAREYGLTAAQGTPARSTAAVAALVADRITKPLRQRDVQSICLWGYHAVDNGRVYQLPTAGPLWKALLETRSNLAVVISPSQRNAIPTLATRFGELFVAI